MSRRHRRENHACYDHHVTKQIELFYAVAAFLWILLVYSLGVYKLRSKTGLLIIAIPLVIYALGFLNASRITRRVEELMLSTDFLAFGLLFVSVLFQMRQNGSRDYTVRIIVVSFILLILSTVDVWTSEKGLTLSRHIRSAARTAAVTLLIFVIYVNVADSSRPPVVCRESKEGAMTTQMPGIPSPSVFGPLVQIGSNES